MRMPFYFERKEVSIQKINIHTILMMSLQYFSSFYSTHIDFFYGKYAVSKGIKIENKHFSSRQHF